MNLKKESKPIGEPHQIPSAIEETTTVFATSIQFDFCLNSISAIKKKEIEWAGGQPGFRTVRLKHADQGLSPISGKPDNILLSIVVGYCILIAFIFLGNVC